MFSFHKPKVYRSVTGCCICKAKSSSSRFTDSTKYEEDFIECFQLEERRNGEICNACVLLIKRWKKLPAGSNRNWRHVVDARAGPGIKSLTKFKAKNKKKKPVTLKDTNDDKIDKIVKKKHVYLKPEREESPTMSDEMNDDDNGSKGSSRPGSPDDCDDIVVIKKRFKCGKRRIVEQQQLSPIDFIDLTYFKRTRICCGIIFKGQYGEVIIDETLFKPCSGCLLAREEKQKKLNNQTKVPSTIDSFHSTSASSSSSSPAHNVDSTTTTTTDSSKLPGKTFSDSSSDSGYDESSNQGIAESKIIDSKNCLIKKSTTIIPIINKQATNIFIQTGNKLQLKPGKKLNETVRLQSDLPIKLIPIKQVDKFTCKPLVSSATKQNSALVDFAIHTSRQSVTN